MNPHFVPEHRAGSIATRTNPVLLTLVACLISTSVFAQSDYSEETLAVKKRFSGIEDAAMADPFVGVTTESGKQADLFPIRATGVSTKPIVESALAFLSTLTQAQKIKTQFAVDDPEWRKWSNVDNGIYVRQGISFEEMVTPSSRLIGKIRTSTPRRARSTTSACSRSRHRAGPPTTPRTSVSSRRKTSRLPPRIGLTPRRFGIRRSERSETENHGEGISPPRFFVRSAPVTRFS